MEKFKVKKKHLTGEIADFPKREKPRCPDSAPRTEATPHEIIQNMLDKGMDVWVCVSDISYDEARDRIGCHAYRVTRYSTDSCYPVWTWYTGWNYAIPIDTATMTEITELPKRDFWNAF